MKHLHKLHSLFVRLIQFIASPNILIIAFSIKLMWSPDYMAVAGLLGSLIQLAYVYHLDHKTKFKKMDLEQAKQLDNTQIKKAIESLHNSQTAITERMQAFEAHKTLNSATMPNGIFNFDPNYMNEGR